MSMRVSIVAAALSMCLGSLAFISTSYATRHTISNIRKNAPKLKLKVLKLALTAFNHAEKKGLSHSPILTVVDFELPSSQKRLWVFNVNTGKVLYHTYVAQGKRTGLKYAHYFSNRPGSRASSLGLYETDSAYYGSDGYSLRLTGLEPGVNNNAYRRDIVVHGAWYVNSKFIEHNGRAGRSWGCFAVSKKLVKPIVSTIKNHSLLFAYYPDQQWLEHSKFL